VLAGEDDAAAGIVLKRGTLGYVPQNPRPRAEAAPDGALAHPVGARFDRCRAAPAELHSSWRKITDGKRRAFSRRRSATGSTAAIRPSRTLDG